MAYLLQMACPRHEVYCLFKIGGFMRFASLLILLAFVGEIFPQSNAVGWSEGVTYRRQLTEKIYLGYCIFPRMIFKEDYAYYEVKNGIQAGYVLAGWERLKLVLAEEIYINNLFLETEDKTTKVGYGVVDVIGFIPQFQIYKALYIEKMFGVSFEWERNKEAQDEKWSDPIDTYRIDVAGDMVNLFSSFRILLKF